MDFLDKRNRLPSPEQNISTKAVFFSMLAPKIPYLQLVEN